MFPRVLIQMLENFLNFHDINQRQSIWLTENDMECGIEMFPPDYKGYPGENCWSLSADLDSAAAAVG